MKTIKLNHYTEVEGIDRIVDIFLEKGERRVYEKGRFFLKEGQRTSKTGYVADGGFRHLFPVSDGRDRVAGYSFVGDFVTVFSAFNSSASAVSIQAIRDTTVYLLDSEEVFGYQTWEFRHSVLSAALADVYGRLLVMHAGTPEERYLGLVTHFPDILNEVSLKEIASFLRMTPETLSRIRKKMLLKRNS